MAAPSSLSSLSNVKCRKVNDLDKNFSEDLLVSKSVVLSASLRYVNGLNPSVITTPFYFPSKAWR